MTKTRPATATDPTKLLHQDEEGQRRQHPNSPFEHEECTPITKENYQEQKRDVASSLPFNVETTLTFDAVKYWAKVDPQRTALVYTDKQWKVKNGKLMESSKTKPKPGSSNSEALITNSDSWGTITYQKFYEKIHRFRVALHLAGVPIPKNHNGRQFRILLLYAPTCRVDILALLLALQAAGCVLLFGIPAQFGGLRKFISVMLKLQPDAVLASRLVYTIFRIIAASTKAFQNMKQKPVWFRSSILEKVAPALKKDQLVQYDVAGNKVGVSLDSIATVMFSSGTTGPPTPIEVTHRMLCFQADGYAKLLQKHVGYDVLKPKPASYDQRTDVLSHNGPWISAHVFLNFVMLDLVLGGTAVMQPMGLSSPDRTVCVATLHLIWNHFDTQITSAPPALWRRMLEIQNRNQQVKSLQLAFVGGAETSSKFARDLSRSFMMSSDIGSNCGGLYRVYGTTQVLPIATASVHDIQLGEDSNFYCARGYGVCLGSKIVGLDIIIDASVWKSKGGKPFLAATDERLILGELCVTGKAISSSMEVVGTDPVDGTAIRKFHTGDICFVEPGTDHIYLLGRMAQAVDCGKGLGLVPPVGIEMICLETKAVQQCAFVGVHKKSGSLPTLVIQLNHSNRDVDMDAVIGNLRRALEKSVWSDVLGSNLRLVEYSKQWPVDVRHSSKTNRQLLQKWASKQTNKRKIYSL